MSASVVIQYRVTLGKRDEFLAAARESAALGTRLGGQVSFRQSTWAGAGSGGISQVARFTTPAGRAAYLDAITKPESQAQNALLLETRKANGAATLVARYMLNEVPASDAALAPPPAVQSSSRWRIPAGHLAGGLAALQAARQLRTELGIRAAVLTTVNGGESTGEYRLVVAYGSYADMEEAGAKVTAYTASHGGAPIPAAVAAGSLVQVGTIVSTLLAL